jgi:hypothetical protein
VTILGSVVLLFAGSPIGPAAWARDTWSEIGHIQVLEGPEKVWVFVEVVRITDYTDELLLHLMSKHPDKEIVSQSVYTVDRLGNVTETVIAKGGAPNLDPDLHPIFRLPDGFYQYSPAAKGRPASFYRWRGDRFGPLDERESKEVKQRLGRVEQAGPLIDALLELDRITEREGWRNLHLHALRASLEREGLYYRPPGDAHRTVFADSFVSDKHRIEIRVRESDRRLGLRALRPSSVVASSLSKSKPWSKTIVEVDTKGSRRRRGHSRNESEGTTSSLPR